MKLLRYSPLILGLLINRLQAQDQSTKIIAHNPTSKYVLRYLFGFGKHEISDSNSFKIKDKKQNVIKHETKLLPVEFCGDLNPRLDAWTTGKTLVGAISNVNGPFYNTGLKAVTGKNFRDTIDAYFEYGDQNTVIKQFEKENPALKTPLLKQYLSQRKPLPKELSYIFRDGNVTSKEELDKLNNLQNGEYIFTFFYRSKDKKASLPGIFIIKKEENNFYIKPVEKSIISDTTRQDKVKQDTPKRKLKKPSFEIFSGYDFDGFVPLEVRVRAGNIYLGPALGFSGGSEKNITTPTINSFYGQGSDNISEFYVGGSVGISLSDYLTLNLNPGIVFRERKVDEKIIRSNGEVVSQNKDTYSNKYARASAGLSYNINNFRVGANLGYNFSENTKAHRKNGAFVGVRVGYGL